MSIYDRDYMNRRPRRGLGGLGLRITSPVSALILFNVAVFFAEAVFDRIYGAGSFFGIFGLSLSALEHGRVWTVLTYSFLHADILHILCNMVGLYYIGKYVERATGTRKFLALYFGGALAGAALWLGMSAFGQTREVLVGASASVMAVFSAFCLLYPPMPITFLLFFVLPISMKPLTMLKVAAGFEILGLLYSLAGGDAVVAYSAHLGGILAGLGFVALLRRGGLSFLDGVPRRKTPDVSRGGRASDYVFKVNLSEPKDLSKEVDRILDKINAEGFASLTQDERETLRRAKDSLK